jgi:hypothetical protein
MKVLGLLGTGVTTGKKMIAMTTTKTLATYHVVVVRAVVVIATVMRRMKNEWS